MSALKSLTTEGEERGETAREPRREMKGTIGNRVRSVNFAAPKVGDLRCVRVFLWLPRTIEVRRRWLESATVGQRLGEGGRWEDFCWME